MMEKLGIEPVRRYTVTRQRGNMFLRAKSKRRTHLNDEDHGETGNRTQNLLHLTSPVKHDAKKMSYH